MSSAVNYTLRQLIQKDLESTLWLADCTVKGKHKGTIALKCLNNTSLFNTTWAYTFHNSCNQIMKLSSSLLAPVADFGFMDKKPYVSVKHFDGISLKNIIDILSSCGLTLPVWFAVPVMLLLCRALKSLHTQISDRKPKPLQRLSPSKIFFTSGGLVKILEHGIFSSKLFTYDSSAKQFYQAPEVRKGESVDLRVDIYSLGAIFYEALAGRIPRDSSSLLPLHIVAPWVPIPLQNIIMTALSEKPDSRPGSFDELENLMCQTLGAYHAPLTSVEIIHILTMIDPDITGISSTTLRTVLKWEKEILVSNSEKFERFSILRKALNREITATHFYTSQFHHFADPSEENARKFNHDLSALIKSSVWQSRSRALPAADYIKHSEKITVSGALVDEDTKPEVDNVANVAPY